MTTTTDVRQPAVPRDVIKIRRAGRGLAGIVALVGAVLSWDSLYRAATPTFGPWLAAGFPSLVDVLIAAASLLYIAGAKVGRPRVGWRLTAHAGVAGTLILNALAAPNLAAIPWHVTAPAVWSVLVELTARDVLGDWKAAHTPGDRIPFRLWLAAPLESARTVLRAARQSAHADHRLAVGQHLAASEAVRLATGGRLRRRRLRRIIRHQLAAGSLPPASVLAAVGWLDGAEVVSDPSALLRRALSAALDPASVPASQRHSDALTSTDGVGQTVPGTTEPAGELPPIELPTAPAIESAPTARRARPRARKASETPAVLPAPAGSKADQVRAALIATDGSTDAVLAWLADRGVTVADRYVRTVRGRMTGSLVTGPLPIIGSGSVPAPGSGSVPAPGSGSVPAPGSGSVPAPGSGSVPAPGSGSVPAPGSGSVPAPGSGSVPAPGSGSVPAPGSGSVPEDGSEDGTADRYTMSDGVTLHRPALAVAR